MDPKFWHEQWELNQIGFHQHNIHPFLREYWSRVASGKGQVFVPLCGKSLDMVWLREEGHDILGVDLSPLAVADFFKEQGLPVSILSTDDFQGYESDGFELLSGDFFELRSHHLAKVTAVYDRAALIAMPPHLQIRYAQHLLSVLPHHPPILLITFEYSETEMQGPPFSVTEQRVNELFGQVYSIEKLSSIDALELQPGLKNRGLSSLTEKVYHLHV